MEGGNGGSKDMINIYCINAWNFQREKILFKKEVVSSSFSPSFSYIFIMNMYLIIKYFRPQPLGYICFRYIFSFLWKYLFIKKISSFNILKMFWDRAQAYQRLLAFLCLFCSAYIWPVMLLRYFWYSIMYINIQIHKML